MLAEYQDPTEKGGAGHNCQVTFRFGHVVQYHSGLIGMTQGLIEASDKIMRLRDGIIDDN